MTSTVELLRAGFDQQQQGRLDQALRYYREALRADPNSAEAWRLSAVALYRLGRLAAALEAYERQLALTPNDAGAWHFHVGDPPARR